jgi:6-phosphofructokinase 1
MTINRKYEAEYSIFYSSEDISGIANAVKTVPQEYINSDGNGVTDECLEYLLPLILGEVSPIYEAGMPKHLII